jgi:hypothetical protein
MTRLDVPAAGDHRVSQADYFANQNKEDASW